MTDEYYDLHIHSCLSPCASDDMTPSNIAGMASIKGLSLIALTDHNCGRNLRPTAKAAAEFGIQFIPGIEVTTAEEVHVLTYFMETDTAAAFGDMLYDSLPDIANRPEIFGRQIVMDENDQCVHELRKLLLQATPYPIDEVVRLARASGGCALPAHVNRSSFSVFSNLGFMPKGLFGAAEVSSSIPCPPLIPGVFELHSSDAHNLGDISEPENRLPGIHNAPEFINFINNISTL